MFKSYYPEMGETKPEAEIEASLSHYGKHYHLYTPLILKGRGIVREETIRDLCGFCNGTGHIEGRFHAHDDDGTCLYCKGTGKARRGGWHRYTVTLKAFDKICAEHDVVSESLL